MLFLLSPLNLKWQTTLETQPLCLIHVFYMLYSWHSCFSLHGLPLDICQKKWGAVATVACDRAVVIFCCLSSCPYLAWTWLWAHGLLQGLLGYPCPWRQEVFDRAVEVEELSRRRKESSWPGFGTVLFVVANIKDVIVRLPLLQHKLQTVSYNTYRKPWLGAKHTQTHICKCCLHSMHTIAQS